MAKKSEYDKIKTGIEGGVYKTLRLVRINDQGEREVLVGYSKANAVQALERLKHIQYQLEVNLPPGEYQIECRCGVSKTSLQDIFKISIKKPVTIPVKSGESSKHTEEQEIIDKTNEQQTMPQEIDFDDYIKLIKENEFLKAQVAVLSTQLDSKQAAPLNDNENQGTAGKILKALEDNMPTALNIFSQFMDQRDKSLHLKERELSLKENGNNGIKKKMAGVNKNDILRDMEELYENDPEAFQRELDAINEKNPAMYNWICQQMDLVDEGEEEEEN